MKYALGLHRLVLRMIRSHSRYAWLVLSAGLSGAIAALPATSLAANDAAPTSAGQSTATAGPLLISSLNSAGAQLDTQARLADRTQYRLALKDLAKNRITEFKRRQKGLQNYLLAPYLEYHYLNKKVATLSARDVKRFTERYAEYPFATRLRDRWLLKLPGQGRWSDYLENYQPSTSTTRRCYHLRALYRSGEREAALKQVEPLWLRGKSQPKACDPLFKAWIGAGYQTDRLVWSRLERALEKNEVSLSRYLLTQIRSAALKKQATLLYQAHVSPQTLFNPNAHKDDTDANRAILRVGLVRLARREPAKARGLWQELRTTHSFSKADINAIESRLLLEGARDNLWPASDQRPKVVKQSVLKIVAREAIRHENWPQASHWIAALEDDTRDEPEWRYWLERSAGKDLAALAAERNYYGFLAAHQLGAETQLHHEPSPIAPATLKRVRRLAGIDRALELYAVDDLINARREWLRSFAKLGHEEQTAAAQLAHSNGWLDQAIMAANAASLHNDLDLRFPQVYDNLYGRASHATNLHPSTLLAVTRQESAFQQRARSSADARGLMQLLPSTAKWTAKKAGLRQPTTLDLYEPAINIRIASEYLARLMARYDQQRPLAFAAYNAGEHRVDRWIKDRSGMPMEVWIENIPYGETRGYVKSVLAFNHLYSKRMNDPVPLLLPHEKTVR